jgi:anti-anti-sigma factor
MLIAQVPRHDLPPLLELGSSRIGHRFVLHGKGEFDLAGIPALLHAARAGFEAGVQEFWLDLTELEFIDVRGIHAVVDLRHRASADGRRLSVICPGGNVRRALELTGAAAELPLYESRAEAHRFA